MGFLLLDVLRYDAGSSGYWGGRSGSRGTAHRVAGNACKALMLLYHRPTIDTIVRFFFLSAYF
jgi:hypothetical protein